MLCGCEVRDASKGLGLCVEVRCRRVMWSWSGFVVFESSGWGAMTCVGCFASAALLV